MRQSDIFVVLDDVQFERNSFINRNRIMVNGKPHWLTIPLKMEGHTSKTIRQMEIDFTQGSAENHWQTIEMAYHKAPYWGEICLYLLEYIDYCWQSPLRLRAFPWEWCCTFAAPKREYHIQSEIGVHGYKLELIVNLCRHFQADAFLFGKEGFEAYGKDLAKYGITPICQQYESVDTPPLSVVHYLATGGIEDTRKLIDSQNKREIHDS
jgi:hypothetical protein